MYFIFEDKIDEKEYVEEQVKGYTSKLIKKATVSYFDKWGTYSGYGARIEGFAMGLMKSELKIFAHSGDTLSFATISQTLHDSRHVDEPGLELMEATFKLKE